MVVTPRTVEITSVRNMTLSPFGLGAESAAKTASSSGELGRLIPRLLCRFAPAGLLMTFPAAFALRQRDDRYTMKCLGFRLTGKPSQAQIFDRTRIYDRIGSLLPCLQGVKAERLRMSKCFPLCPPGGPPICALMSTRPRGLAVFPVASELGLSPGFRDTKRRKSGKPDPARHAHQ